MTRRRDSRGRFIPRSALLPEGTSTDARGRLRDAAGRFIKQNNEIVKAKSDTEGPSAIKQGKTTNIDEFRAEINEWTINIAEDMALDFQRAVAILATDLIVLKTPVDKGRARANWICEIGSIPTNIIDAVDTSGEKTKAAAGAKIAAVRELTYIVIGNNLPYINTLETGGYVPKDPKSDEPSNERRALGRDSAQRRRGLLVGGHEGAPFVRGGYSLQAPKGMVSVTFQELINAFGRGPR